MTGPAGWGGLRRLSLLLGLAACGEGPTTIDEPGGSDDTEVQPDEPDIRGAHLDIFLDPGTRLCPTTAERLDAEVERLADAIGVSLDGEGRIPLFLGESSVKERCDVPQEVGEFIGGGCTHEAGEWIAAQAGAESHELVHALRLRAGLFGPPYWEEGLATNLGSRRPYSELLVWPSGDRQPAQWLRSSVQPEQAGYTESAHFIAYLEHVHGADSVRELSRALGEGAEPDLVFEQALGISLDAAQEQWTIDAGPMYELGPICEQELVVSEVPVVLRGEIACDVPGVIGPAPNVEMEVLRGPRYCLETPPGSVLTVTVRGSADGVVQARSLGSEACPPEEPNLGGNVVPGSERDFEAGGCTWSVAYLSTLEGDGYEIELMVR